MTASGAGLSAAYAYDPLGRRTTKTVSGTVTSFLHDGDSEIADYDGGGNLLRRYVPGPAIDDYVAMITAAGTATFFHTDKTGSIVGMSDASGNLVEGPYTYDAYGNCFSGGGAGGGAWVSNARTMAQTSGGFRVQSLTLGIINFQFAQSGQTWVLSVSPTEGGLGYSEYHTNTFWTLH